MTDGKVKQTFVGNTLPLIYLIVGLFALRWTIVEPYVVPTGSMEPTLKVGDRLYALKCAYDIRFPFTDLILFRTGKVNRGDVILFKAPHDPGLTYVKRAVGIPGDKIRMQDGILYVNGNAINKKPYPNTEIMYDISRKELKTLYLENLTGVQHYVILDNYAPNIRNFPEIEVPADNVFAVGDNRDNSSDSRVWGFAPMQNMKGKAMFIWFSAPVDPPQERPFYAEVWKWIVGFVSFWDWHIRWERIGTPIG